MTTLTGVQLDPAQQRFFADPSRVQVVCWHRQKGKDFTTAAKSVLHALETGQPWYIVSLTQRQADATFEKCVEWAKRYETAIEQVIETDFSEYDADFDHTFEFRARELRLPGGGRVVSLPGRDPDRLAGLTGNVVFTEMGLFPNGGYDHWRVVFPLATRGFHVIAISTPRSKSSKFYELVSQPELYSVHFCGIHQSIAEGFVLRDQGGEPTDLDTFKRLYGDDAGFEREYECKFTGDLSTLIKWALLEAAGERGRVLPFDLCEVKADAGWSPEFFRKIRTDATHAGRFEIGWDVARRGDISALSLNMPQSPGAPDRHLRALVLMRNTSFALQREIVSAAMDVDPRAVGRGDSTGLGMDSNETLEAKYPHRWQGIDFGGKRKSDLGSGLATAFSDASQTVPPLDGPHKYIATDLYAIQKQTDAQGEVDESGKGRLKLVETNNPLLPESHCDIAYSLALAIAAGHGTSESTPGVRDLGLASNTRTDPLESFVLGEAA